MALDALHINMLAEQLELGLVVVELGGLPILVGVALRTVRAQAALVLVIFLVTIVTVTGGFAEFLLRLVASLTLCLLPQMPAPEDEIGQFVIESFLVELGRLEIPPFMLGMAFLAFFFKIDTAVIPLLLSNVLAHVLVAIHAQFGLRFLVEFLVTYLAVRFFLDVPLDDIAGHQQFIGLHL